jgi:Winged helix-turn-helix DNA-binding
MPYKPTGRPVGRQLLYTSGSERPKTISLRVPADLHKQMEAYASIHRQSITELLLDGLRWRIGVDDPRDLAPPPDPPEPCRHYGNTAIPTQGTGEGETATILKQLIQQVERLTQALEHQEHPPVPPATRSNTVIPPNVPESREPVGPDGMADKRPNYGKLTAAVLEAIKDRTRFTSAEIAQELGRKPTTVWQALQGLVKKGVLKQRGRYGEAVYIKIEREGR